MLHAKVQKPWLQEAKVCVTVPLEIHSACA